MIKERKTKEITQYVVNDTKDINWAYFCVNYIQVKLLF